MNTNFEDRLAMLEVYIDMGKNDGEISLKRIPVDELIAVGEELTATNKIGDQLTQQLQDEIATLGEKIGRGRP